ncbi:Polysaccharide export protein [hydrothermal vent metagenome]|uniref:Polysaccharide export protein n=1 Tax=hydrothermal vent metagenome TaxID=652676 RepID=A0A3B0S4E4_9ZZZZ
MRFILVCFIAFSLSACASTWEKTRPATLPGGVSLNSNGSVTEGPGATASVSIAPQYSAAGKVLPPFGSQGVAAAYEGGAGYRIGAGDSLTIRVVGQPDLTGDYIVDGSGLISFPLIKSVKVGGLTAPQIRSLVAARLRQGYLRNPSVSVQTTNLRPFFILGEVGQAGSFPYQNGMTVQNAIAIAGGYSPRANQKDVMLTRKDANGTQTVKVPITTQIYPGDIIFVRERWF